MIVASSADHPWLIATVVVGVVAVVAPIGLYAISREQRALWWWWREAPIVASSEGPLRRISAMLDGAVIENLRLATFEFYSGGNRALNAADFERPIAINLGRASPVTVEFAHPHPSDLSLEVTIDESTVRIQPLLLNPKEGFEVVALVGAGNVEP